MVAFFGQGEKSVRVSFGLVLGNPGKRVRISSDANNNCLVSSAFVSWNTFAQSRKVLSENAFLK